LCNVIAFNTDASKTRILQALSDDFTDIVFYGITDVEPLILKDIMYDFEFEYDKTQMDKLDSIERKIAASLLE